MINGDDDRSLEQLHQVAVTISAYLDRYAIEDDAASSETRALLKRYRNANHLFWVHTGEPVPREARPVPGDRVVAYAHGQVRAVGQVVADLVAHPYWEDTAGSDG